MPSGADQDSEGHLQQLLDQAAAIAQTASMPAGWAPVAGHEDSEGPTAYLRDDKRAMVSTGGGYVRGWYVYKVTGWQPGGQATAVRLGDPYLRLQVWREPAAAAVASEQLLPREADEL